MWRCISEPMNRNINHVKADIFELFYKLVAVTAVICGLSALPITFIVEFMGARSFSAILLPICFLILGYVLQSLYAAGAKLQRVKNATHSYENTGRYFKPEKSIIAIVICIGIAIIVFVASFGVMKLQALNGKIPYYDPLSPMPYVTAGISLLFMIIGVALWFYPYDRIITLLNFLYLCVIQLVVMIFTSGGTLVTNILFAIFLFCSCIVMNQSYVDRMIGATDMGAATGNMRIYNISLVVMVAICALFLTAVAFTIVLGFYLLGRMLLYMTLSAIFKETGKQYYRGSDAAADFNEVVFDLEFLNIEGSTFGQTILITLILLIIGTALFFIFAKRYNLVGRFKRFFILLYNSILDFINNLFKKRSREDNTVALNYRDEEQKMDGASVREYNENTDRRERMTYREFSNRFNSLKNDHEKMIFAYGFLTECWRGMDAPIAISDTPRVIRDKIVSRFEIRDISRITDAFELTHYSDTPPAPGEMKETLTSMCRLAAKYCET